MNNQQINEAIMILKQNTMSLEQTYIENGGEVTEDTERMAEDVAALQVLLQEEGTDSLGRWLKAKQDEIAMYKAEKAAADARIKAAQKTEAYIKEQIDRVMEAIGAEKVKGSFYAFSRYTSTKSAIDEQALDDAYLSKVLIAARTAGLPDSIDVELKTTTTRLKEGGLEQYVTETSTPTVKFVKPRAAKEN